MKSLFFLSVLAFGLSANAFSPATGKFEYKHDVVLIGYHNEVDCKADQGKWDGDYCRFDGSDSVEVGTTDTPGEFLLSISTVGTNSHTCDFQAPAKLVKAHLLIAEVKTEEGLCQVLVKYSRNRNSVSVEATNACRVNNCGMRAGLDIKRAARTGN